MSTESTEVTLSVPLIGATADIQLMGALENVIRHSQIFGFEERSLQGLAFAVFKKLENREIAAVLAYLLGKYEDEL